MARRTSPLLPVTEELLRQLGDRLRLARLRRRLSISHVAERAGMVPMTLRSVERGASGVTIGAYLAAMQVLGIEKDVDLLAQADPLGRALQDARLPSRSKGTRTRDSLARNVTQHKRAAPVSRPAQLHSAENSIEGQSPAVFTSRPSEQVRKALEVGPEDTIRDTPAAPLPSQQVREMFSAAANAMENLSKPAEDARNWIEKSGFASSQALVKLLDATAPLSKSKRR